MLKMSTLKSFLCHRHCFYGETKDDKEMLKKKKKKIMGSNSLRCSTTAWFMECWTYINENENQLCNFAFVYCTGKPNLAKLMFFILVFNNLTIKTF